jgi:magnesium chelatase subunit D
MAERVEPGAAARLTAAMDLGFVTAPREGLDTRARARFGLILLDEGIAEDERPPAPLLDRLAFHIDLTGIGPRHVSEATVHDALPRPNAGHGPGTGDPAAEPGDYGQKALASPPLGRGPATQAPEWFGSVTIEDAAVEALCGTAMMLGIDSLRAPLLAVRAARAAAVLNGRTAVAEADLILAARLVLAPRATRVPPTTEPDPGHETEADADAAKQSSHDDVPDTEASVDRTLDDVVLEAARAALPADLLARLAIAGGPVRSRQTGRAGQAQTSTRRGRPIGVRLGQPKAGARLHVLETLKAAAPWQKLRAASASRAGIQGLNTPGRLHIRPADFRIVRCRQRGETTTVFAVDASGSAALHRLGEAKGAVELLLADCYVRRDQVALIAFRGRDATVLLPPTRSLVRAKRCLAGLPGGGATPLAAGIDAASALADAERRRGRTPVIVLLTDARANIARDGTGGRQRAETEALASAQISRAAGFTTLVVDTSPRPNPFAGRLAETMRARYVPLPRADASTLSQAVRSATAA